MMCYYLNVQFQGQRVNILYLHSYEGRVYTNNTEQGRQIASANFQVMYDNTVQIYWLNIIITVQRVW